MTSCPGTVSIASCSSLWNYLYFASPAWWLIDAHGLHVSNSFLSVWSCWLMEPPFVMTPPSFWFISLQLQLCVHVFLLFHPTPGLVVIWAEVEKVLYKYKSYITWNFSHHALLFQSSVFCWFSFSVQICVHSMYSVLYSTTPIPCSWLPWMEIIE